MSQASILQLRRISFESRSPVVNMVVSNCIIVAATLSCSLLISSTRHEKMQKPQYLELPHAVNDSVLKLFLDSSGVHLIVILRNGSSIYVNTKLLITKKLSTEMGKIECCSFSVNVGVNLVLLGTSSGSIYELLIGVDGDEIFFQLVHKLEHSFPITSIWFEHFSSHNYKQNTIIGDRNRKAAIIFTTTNPTRLYHCVTHQFIDVKQLLCNRQPNFILLPGNNNCHNLYISRGVSSDGAERHFALMTDAGIYHGVITMCNTSSENVLINAQLIPYELRQAATAIRPNYTSSAGRYIEEGSSSMVPTRHHFVIVRSDGNLVLINKLSGEVVPDTLYGFTKNDGEVVLGVVADPETNQIYLYTALSVNVVDIVDEEMTNLMLYLKKGFATGDLNMFDSAIHLCKTTSEKLDVARIRAEFELAKNSDPSTALTFLGRLPLSVDETALRSLNIYPLFVDNRSNNELQLNYNRDNTTAMINFVTNSSCHDHAVIHYLEAVLSKIPSTMKSQRTMISTWLCECYLHEIVCRDKATIGQIANDSQCEALERFLVSNKKFVDQDVASGQLIDRGVSISSSMVLNYFHLVGNYEQAINSLINDKKYLEAIKMLKEGTFEKVEKLIYSWSPLLIEKHPFELLDMIVTKPKLKQCNLLPTWLRYTEILGRAASASTIPSIAHIMTFLKGLWGAAISDSLLHTTASSSFPSAYLSLVWMLCKYEEDTDNEAMLVSILKFECDPALDALPLVISLHDNRNYSNTEHLGPDCNPFVDYDFILRLCQSYNKKRGTVYTYLILGLHTHALDAAVAFDVPLAKVCF